MCVYIDSKNIMPGYICHTCKSYNGLQRGACKDCGELACKVDIPDYVIQCPSCSYGIDKQDAAGMVGNLAGVRFSSSLCPNCKNPWKWKAEATAK